ncbi:hypothetical protein [Serratia proteamaculans]|uniref:hypothetical protein n=1 Tax=Serratia proteamaculans TaxID=28151 RepID=UPI00124A5525|nr:hypothetical protein [Serratia proteamaculans]KAB1498444.1 hypothetical protein F8R23_03020 [Serratia proteamaculans]
MEIGSLTDWLSAGANIFMAGAAIYAAVNAKDWIKDKHNSAGYDHVAKLMADYDTVVLEMNRFYFQMLDLQKSDDEFHTTKKNIEDHVYTVLPLQDRLKACRRFNIKSKVELEQHFQDLVRFYNLCLKIYGALKLDNIKMFKEAKTNLDQQYLKVEGFKKNLDTDIKNLFFFS